MERLNTGQFFLASTARRTAHVIPPVMQGILFISSKCPFSQTILPHVNHDDYAIIEVMDRKQDEQVQKLMDLFDVKGVPTLVYGQDKQVAQGNDTILNVIHKQQEEPQPTPQLVPPPVKRQLETFSMDDDTTTSTSFRVARVSSSPNAAPMVSVRPSSGRDGDHAVASPTSASLQEKVKMLEKMREEKDKATKEMNSQILNRNLTTA